MRIRELVPWVLLVLGGACCWRWIDDAPVSPSHADDFSLQVVDARGEPVGGARLEEWNDIDESLTTIARSDARGILTLPYGAPTWGWSSRQIRAEGFALWSPAGTGTRRAVLSPAGRFRVEVTDPSGEPVSGARVTLFHETLPRSDNDLGATLRPPEVADVASTGDDGVLEFGQVPDCAADYRLTVRKGGYLVARASGAAARDADGRVVVRVRLATGGTVTGRIVDSDGAPLAGVPVTAGGHKTSTDGKGLFRIEGVRGSVDVIARHPTRGVAAAGGVVPWVPGAGASRALEFGDIWMEPAVRVRFRLGEDGPPEVMAFLAGTAVQLATMPARAQRFAGPGPHELVLSALEADGWVALEVLSPRGGLHSVRRRVAKGRTELDLGVLDVPDRPAVRGRVVDPGGRPVPRGVVSLRHACAAVDADGRFVLHPWTSPPWVPIFYAAGETSPSGVGPVITAQSDAEMTIRTGAPGRVEVAARAAGPSPEDVAVAIVPFGLRAVPSDWARPRRLVPGRDEAFTATLPPGRYAVGVVNLDVAEWPFDGTPQPVEVVVRSGARARVVLPCPARGRIEAWPRSMSGEAPRITESVLRLAGPASASEEEIGLRGLDGVIRWRVPRDGRWLVVVTTENLAPFVSRPLTLRHAEPLGLGPIDFEPGRTVRVHARGGERDSVTKARLRAYELPVLDHLGIAPLEGDGVLERVPSRAMGIVAVSDDRAPIAFRIPAGGDVERQVEFAPGRAERIRVVDERGVGMPSAEVFVLAGEDGLPILRDHADGNGELELANVPVSGDLAVLARTEHAISEPTPLERGRTTTVTPR